jgi:hypothetical protein
MVSEFLGYILKACSDFWDFLMVAVYAQVAPDWRFILRIFVLAVFLFGSAFLAATIAESRRHKMKFHFLLGLVLPYIYPLVIALRMKTIDEVLEIEEEFDPLADLSSSMSARFREIQGEQKAKHDERVKRVEPHQKEQEAVEKAAAQIQEQAEAVEPEKVEAAEPEEVVEETPSVFTQRYFQSVAVDSSGAKAGPFSLVAKNGTQFRVSQIKTIQSDMASFEIEVKGKLKNIRIRYDNIESFEKI